jgi:hypothetical protein
LKLLERSVSAHHQVADDQQRPSISKDFERHGDWTSGPPLRLWLGPHGETQYKVRLQKASD